MISQSLNGVIFTNNRKKEDEFLMKKALMIFILTLSLLATAGAAFSEDMAKGGTFNGKYYSSVTVKVLDMGEGRFQINFSSTGTLVSDTKEGFLHLAAVYTLGTGHAAEGVVVETGSTVITATDGDKVYATFKGSGALREHSNGVVTFTGGTGRYTGIQGEGEYTRFPLPLATEGVWTSMDIVKTNYKLP